MVITAFRFRELFLLVNDFLSVSISLINLSEQSFIGTDIMRLKGYLRPLMLKLLSQEDKRTGSELAKEIEGRLGSKPSYGSIYPNLQKLVNKDFLKVKQEGKKKKYSLTNKGEKFVSELEEKKRDHTESLLSMLRTFKTLFEDEDIELLIENIKNKTNQETPQFPEIPQIHHLILTKDIEGREEKIREALEETLEKVEKILEVQT